MARRLPTFFPSISNDKRTWFWKNNLHSEGLLISIDVLEKISGLKNSKHDHINLILGFDGMVILDNGAFGSFIPIDPLLLFSKQANLKPAIAIALDSIPSSSFQEMESVKITVKNAKRISK
ncbi:MAG: hypothetical protein IPM96_16180 [Ignavibacteria bacterium]|nr:hypothetical protein [Ignavibacteria bacterium]